MTSALNASESNYVLVESRSKAPLVRSGDFAPEAGDFCPDLRILANFGVYSLAP